MPARLTLGDVSDQYLERHVRVPTRRKRGRREMEIAIAMFRRAESPAANGSTTRLEAKPIDTITRADIEAVRTGRRRQLAAGVARSGPRPSRAPPLQPDWNDIAAVSE
jgi:hypothetical protein